MVRDERRQHEAQAAPARPRVVDLPFCLVNLVARPARQDWGDQRGARAGGRAVRVPLARAPGVSGEVQPGHLWGPAAGCSMASQWRGWRLHLPWLA